MGIFNKKDDKKISEKPKKSAVKTKEAKKPRIVNLTLGESDLVNKALIQPWITEKTHDLMGLNKYVFKVAQKTNKKQVKKAIEALYGVKVEDVSIVKIHSEKKRFGKTMGHRSGYKKAIVSLKKGNRIDIFERV